LAHCSYEAGILEDPDQTPPDDMWVMTPDGSHTESVDLFKALNKIGRIHGIGRIDIVENRLIGLKSRGCYDCMIDLLNLRSLLT
jgi:argininosuccinate synthase